MDTEKRVQADHRNTPIGGVTAGKSYRIVATGRWVDLVIPCTAKGFRSPALMRRYESARRMPEANWFALIGFILAERLVDPGALPPNGTALFDLSSHVDGRQPWTCHMTGVLHVFPNDLEDKYSNNWGFITVSLIQLA